MARALFDYVARVSLGETDGRTCAHVVYAWPEPSKDDAPILAGPNAQLLQFVFPDSAAFPKRSLKRCVQPRTFFVV